LLTLVGGVMAGNCMVPQKFVRHWRWENTWLVFSLVSLVLIPWLLAFLTIGDLALTQAAAPDYAYRYDLGALWHEFSGLPFVFAVWHVNYKKKIEKELASLYDILITSKAYGLSHLQELAREYTERFNISPQVLLNYWESFSYDLGEDERKGLLAYYDYAAEIGASEAVSELRFWERC